ncbi:hypothetical protein KDA23_03480 [Candidatus Saccharibacteria bacterium]|nr:hypothetical protein [Candidatus Saccharibacteria bacterium]
MDRFTDRQKSYAGYVGLWILAAVSVYAFSRASSRVDAAYAAKWVIVMVISAILGTISLVCARYYKTKAANADVVTQVGTETLANTAKQGPVPTVVTPPPVDSDRKNP